MNLTSLDDGLHDEEAGLGGRRRVSAEADQADAVVELAYDDQAVDVEQRGVFVLVVFGVGAPHAAQVSVREEIALERVVVVDADLAVVEGRATGAGS